MIHRPLFALPLLALASLPLQERPRDISKAFVEQPLERALAADEAGAPRASSKVPPGLVRWHADFEAACAAARSSGKPVLLFQLLGRLDDELC
jgi:hypothetical protein